MVSAKTFSFQYYGNVISRNQSLAQHNTTQLKQKRITPSLQWQIPLKNKSINQQHLFASLFHTYYRLLSLIVFFIFIKTRFSNYYLLNLTSKVTYQSLKLEYIFDKKEV
ncbi:MAG: hypothetical protein ACI89T_000501 [Cognaticolwellia sp.]|jgi:hypothetical protein